MFAVLVKLLTSVLLPDIVFPLCSALSPAVTCLFYICATLTLSKMNLSVLRRQ